MRVWDYALLLLVASAKQKTQSRLISLNVNVALACLGTVTEVDMHPHEPIVGSCSIDRRIYLGEIEE